MVFAGPAGTGNLYRRRDGSIERKTGKTYSYSTSRKQGKIWISSGDMKEKLDPYMQPL
jgi:hypothetical protein